MEDCVFDHNVNSSIFFVLLEGHELRVESTDETMRRGKIDKLWLKLVLRQIYWVTR